MIERRKKPKTVLPLDLVEEEILQRLPVKSLLRFKSVSKQWRSMIESTHFVEKHLGCSFSNPKVLVVGAKTTRGGHENLLTFLLETFSSDDQGENDAQINRFTSSCTFPDPIRLVRLFYKVVGSCDGLICIKDRRDSRRSTDYKTTIYIINPMTRKHRIFHPEQLHQGQDLISDIGFGKDMVTGTYKLILLSRNIDFFDTNNLLKTSVLTLDNGSTRRDIGFFPVSSNKIAYYHAPVLANGSVIWFTAPRYGMSSSEKTPIDFVALDLHTEKFRRIMWPSWYVEHRRNMRLWSLKKRLCLSDVKQYPDVDVWSLKMEDSIEKWEKIFSINVSSIGRLDTHFWMVGLEAAYLKRNTYLWSEEKETDEEEEETDVDQFPSFAGWKTTLYTESLVSPYQGI